METATKAKQPDENLLSELLEVGLEMQDRFAAEPVYAKTGLGHLKSVGVSKLKELNAERAN